MGWKNVKNHYRIGHLVQVRDGKILIGSPYVPDLITITLEGRFNWGPLGPCRDNKDLMRYYAEMEADPDSLMKLVELPDTFARSITVYTYKGAEIIKTHCEELDWPNVTHDGVLMYENSHHTDKAVVVGWAKRNARLGEKSGEERVAEKETELKEARGRLEQSRAEILMLDAEYPEIQPAKSC